MSLFNKDNQVYVTSFDCFTILTILIFFTFTSPIFLRFSTYYSISQNLTKQKHFFVCNKTKSRQPQLFKRGKSNYFYNISLTYSSTYPRFKSQIDKIESLLIVAKTLELDLTSKRDIKTMGAFSTYTLAFKGLFTRQKDIIISDNYRNKFQSVQTFQMKNIQCGSPRSNNLNKRISTADPTHIKSKQFLRNQNEDYLSPMHIKLAKNKVKPKKQNKAQKVQNNLDQKRTKRKSMKKSTLEINNTIIVNDTVVKKITKRQGQSHYKLKTKTTQKTFRQTFKSDDKKAVKNECFTIFQQKSMMEQSVQRKKKKIATVKQDTSVVSNEQYLFIGDQFFLVNNLNPSKRLLNTFREICKKDQPYSRFITQDKQVKSNLKPFQKKINIFSEIKKYFQLNFKNQKATKIQRWWRKYITSKKTAKNKPEYIPQQNQALNNLSPKKSFTQSQQLERKSPFQLDSCISSPVKGKIENGEDSIIVSFNSAEKLDETIKAKKISFTKEDITKLITPSYRLPEIQVNADENEAVFSSYAQFRFQQVNNLDVSSDVSPQKQILSSQKSANNLMFQSKIKQQRGLDKVIDNHANLLREFQEAIKIKEQIDFRVSFQKGMIKLMDNYNTKVGISTSILAIHSFLVNFFNFYIQRYQDEFISLINMPYGHSIQGRLREIHGYRLPETVEQDQEGVLFGVQEIIDDQKLQEYYLIQTKSGKNITNFAKANLELQKIHNKSVIDFFNHLLNDYRPYKQINGVPYPWNHSQKALTFYFVTEENIAQVFEKVEIQILKDSSTLSGLILLGDKQSQSSCRNFDTTQFMQNYQQQFHPLVFEHNEERELKCCHEQIKRDPLQYNSQDITRILIQISSQILQELVLQHYEQLKNFNSFSN